MAFNVNGTVLKYFDVVIDGTTYQVNSFDIIENGVSTTVWESFFAITDIWSGYVSASSAGEDGVDEQYNKSGAIDVSKYSKLIWAGDTGNQHNYGTNTLKIYGGSSEGASNYFSYELTPGESFSYEIDISSISTIYLTAYAKCESYTYATEGTHIATTTLRAE